MGPEVDMQESASKAPTFWGWLRSALRSRDVSVEDRCVRSDPSSVVTTISLVPAASSNTLETRAPAAQPQAISSPANGGVILPFPIHGEALLVKLAAVLRKRVADSGPAGDPLLLTLSRSPRSRLSIDRAAHVEFDRERCEYRAVIETSQETKVILETADFDVLVDFVLPYVVVKLIEHAALEAAS